jgi:hypothetical protein
MGKGRKFMSEVKVNLSTVCGGALEDRFQELVPEIISRLGKDQKATIAINLEFKRVPDTATMVSTTFTITPKFPATKKASICQIVDGYGLKTEAPVEKPKVVNMFSGGEKA